MSDTHLLVEVITQRMPFGKYKGRLICDLPEHYLVWFRSQGFPSGKLGLWLETMYEIRLNGLEHIIHEIKRQQQLP